MHYCIGPLHNERKGIKIVREKSIKLFFLFGTYPETIKFQLNHWSTTCTIKNRKDDWKSVRSVKLLESSFAFFHQTDKISSCLCPQNQLVRSMDNVEVMIREEIHCVLPCLNHWTKVFFQAGNRPKPKLLLSAIIYHDK